MGLEITVSKNIVAKNNNIHHNNYHTSIILGRFCPFDKRRN
jgi:hypothetical protein